MVGLILRFALLIGLTGTPALYFLFAGFRDGSMPSFLFGIFLLIVCLVIILALRHHFRLVMMPVTLISVGIALIGGTFLLNWLLELLQAWSDQPASFRAALQTVLLALRDRSLSGYEWARLGAGGFLTLLGVVLMIFRGKLLKPSIVSHGDNDDFKVSIEHGNDLYLSGTLSITNHGPTELKVFGLRVASSLISIPGDLGIYEGSSCTVEIDQTNTLSIAPRRSEVLSPAGRVSLRPLGKIAAKFPKLMRFIGLLTLRLRVKASSGKSTILVRPRLV